METRREQFVWTERYRPQTIADCILPSAVEQTLRGIMEQKATTNLLFSGRAGVGKTTVARALVRELEADALVINASEENGIDVLRNKIKQYASSVSLDGTRKYVILDEADYLNPSSTQPALRAFIEEFSHSCGFILTCNFPSRIIAPVQSRCSLVDFKIPSKEKQNICMLFVKRAEEILTNEKVTYNRKVVAQVVLSHFPDFRRVLNELQRFSTTGELSEAILAQIADKDVAELFAALKAQEFSGIRKWIALHEDMDETAFYRMLSENVFAKADASSLPELVIQMADYGYRAGLCADKQLNALACLVELMHTAKWK